MRLDEDCLQRDAVASVEVSQLLSLHPAIRARSIGAFLEMSGVKEATAQQIEAVEGLLYSEKPSASVCLSGDVVIGRNYGKLQVVDRGAVPAEVLLTCPGSVCFCNYRITAVQAEKSVNTRYCFTVSPVGEITVRSRRAEDKISFAFGTKSLKKLFIDEKIPARERPFVPVIADDMGVLGVCGFGADVQRTAIADNLVEIKIEQL